MCIAIKHLYGQTWNTQLLAIWSPFNVINKAKLEQIQCRAAGYIFNYYSTFHSVSAMLNQLNWPTLESQRNYLTDI